MGRKNNSRVTESDVFLSQALDSDVIRFTGVSVSFLRSFYDDVLTGRLAKDVEIAIAMEKLAEDVPIGRTMKLLEDGMAYIPYRKDKVLQPYNNNQVRTKPRNEWTIGDMCDFVILPHCESSNSFYLDFVDHRLVGKEFQGTFVSQARQCPFEKLVDSLEIHFLDKNLDKEFVWLDIFCANQPRLTSGDAQVLKEKLGLLTHGFHSAIKNFDNFVIFFDSWNDPTPLKRAWCIWELYGAAISGKSVQIALLPTEKQVFIDALREYYDSAKFAILNIQPKEAECFDKEDLAMIRATVESDVGWVKLKSLVVKELLNWMTNMAKEACSEAENEINEAGLLHLGTTITNAQNRILFRGFDPESVVYQRIVSKLIPTSRLMCSTGIFLRDHSSEAVLDEALEYFEKAVKIGIMANENPVKIMLSYNNMASIYSLKRNDQKALQLYQTCYNVFSQMKDLQGMAGILNNIGVTQQQLGEHEKALESFKESYQICLSTLGESHEDVGNPLLNMGRSYEQLGDTDSAIQSYRESLNVFLSAYGNEDHPKIANVHEKMGRLYFKQKNYSDSLEMFQKAYNIRISIFGSDKDPETTLLLHHMGIVHLNQGDYATAVKILEEVYDIQFARYQSEENPAVLAVLDDLAFARRKLQMS